MVPVTVIFIIAVGLLITEKIIISRNVTSLGLRIHINGTRGKSSVTEYISAGLLNGEKRVIAKITGIFPTLIDNGTSRILKRAGVARVQEQFSVIRYAASRKADALVLECMSISPELQRLESRIFRPHIYVITNIKDDHREVMGETPEEQAVSICNAIPKNCRVITNERRFLDLIRESAAQKNSTVIIPAEADGITGQLPPGVFSENISLAIAVCREAGIATENIIDVIIEFADMAASPLFSIETGGHKINFLNGFAVNDTESTISFIDYWLKETGYIGNYSVLLNTRADRPLRTDLFVTWIKSQDSSVDHVFITGDHAARAHLLLRKSLPDSKIHPIAKSEIKNIKVILTNNTRDGSLLVGVGNTGGEGNWIIEILK